ncbi:MAG: hypothetical protein IPI93_10110 [Sphingobacteriaceae bacterium]|nr:hypothetical protein [Sphingobacteriaceae bacterium]
MEKKSVLSIILLFLGGVVFTLPLFFNPYNTMKSISYGKNDSYEKLWQRVDSCESKGLTESALKIVEVIYQKAKTDNNAPQFVKAVINRMKYKQYKEEFSLEKNINELQVEVQTAKFPVKPVLQSLLADAYWQYFNNNRWKFYNRTQTVGFKNEDVSTWDLKTITYAVISNYKESVSNADSLKATRVDVFDEVIYKGTQECREWRPTLYDFLAHRALVFMANTEPNVQRPAARFNINDAGFLAPASEFTKIQLVNPSDSLETKYYALQIIQDLINFHLNDKNPDALIDADLYRLDYIHGHTQHPKKDTLYFNTLKQLQQTYSTHPRSTEIDFRLATWYNNKASEYNPLENDSYKWYKKQAKELCEATIKKMPNTYGAKQCQNLIYQIEAKSLNLTLEEVNEPLKPFRALVSSTNINKLYFKIVKTSHQELRKVYRKEWGEKLYNALNSLPSVKVFEQSIEDDKDYQKHQLEIKMPELPFGHYVVITSLNPDFKYSNNLVSYAQCVVSNIATMERRREDDGAYDIYALHRQTGEALKNISVQVWHETYDYTSRDYKYTKGDLLKTSEKGLCSIKPKDKYNDNSFYLELIDGQDSYFNNNSYYTYKPGDNNYTTTHTHFFTDRAIYRPGQTVYFKGIILETKNGKSPVIKPNYPVNVTFYDANYQKVSSLELTSNEYGSINGTFIAPQGLMTGQMHITDGHGTAYIRVEEYKRPKFETDFDPVKGSFKINDEITVTGKAKAYAGNVIDGAKVSYRVVRKVNYPYWWWWYRPYYNRGGDVEILNGETLTNDTGSYIIKFKASPDESVNKESQATYQYQILADVTDINGETHSTSSYVTVGYQSLQLNISNQAIIDQKAIKPINIITTNLNGVAEAAKGNFTVYKLKQPDRAFRARLWTRPDRHALSKEEYYKTFPNDLYADELNKFKWEKDKQFEKTFDTGSKTEYDLSADLKHLKPGVYMIEANCKDKFGESIKAFQYFTLYDNGSTTMPEVLPAWFYMPKLNAEPGEKVNFVLASAYDKVNYIYEVERQGKLALTQFQSASLGAVTIDVQEEDRGNISFHTSFIKYNRFYNFSNVVTVPFTNKELDIQFETFRNKLLPGQQEEWKIVIKDKKGDKQAAELLTSMYDASLDAFAPSYWSMYIYNSYYTRYNWYSRAAQINNSTELNNVSRNYVGIPGRYYDHLNYFGLNFYSYNYRGGRSKDYYEDGDMKADAIAESSAMPMEEKEMNTKDKSVSRSKNGEASKKMAANKPGLMGGEDGNVADEATTATGVTGGSEGKSDKDLGSVKARSNFNETAFFFPNLTTNENGETVIKFTIPESLTKWKLQGLAHTKDLKIGQYTKEVITQKELMVQPNQPRFFRENDKIIFISKIANLSDKELSGNAELKLYDALTDKEISFSIIEALSGKFPTIGWRDFTVKKGQSTAIEWTLNIPESISAIKYKIVAKAGNFSDGEEMVIPVLTNRMLVTESMPLPIRSNQTKEFNFTKFINQNGNSTTLKNHAYTLEFTANPAWYAVQALPYIMEYPYECAEQTFARYYANSLATYVVNSKPKIKAVFESWKTQSPDAFLSNLQKNQELKALILEETPWVLQAQNESENKKRVALLFDLNTMSNEQARAFKKLKKAQTSNGGFWWFEGGPDDWYITQHICSGFGHLDKLGVIKVKENSEVSSMMYQAVRYCDNRMREDYEWMKKHNKDYLKENHLSYMAIQYLYMRSFFPEIEMDKRNKEHVAYYKKQEQTYWLSNSRYMQGMIALTLHRDKDLKTPKDILKSLKENSLNSEEMGMYWKENYGYYWYEAPIEMQALMIEAFDEVNNDTKAVDDLKTWLVKSKQTQHWGTTRATTEAVYAMLLKGTDWLSTEPNVEIQVGDIKLDPKTDASIKVEPGTGYFKKTWTGSDIKPNMGKVKVIKKDVGVSYGAVYWQYFEQLDKITPHETPLKLKKQLFLQKNTASGPVIEPITAITKLKLGDKIKVRIELRVDRDMDYVHMKDMRASGFEPVNVFSQYKWQDGLGYFESTKDAATNFFFPHLHKGTFVFEYVLFVNHYGDFSNGVTTIQCMYAPEFTSHSEGVRVQVNK